MRTLNSLFALDPTQYSMGRNSGFFTGVVKKNDADALELGKLLSTLSVPQFTGKTPSYDPANVPVVNPIPQDIVDGFTSAKAKLTPFYDFYRSQTSTPNISDAQIDALYRKGTGYWHDLGRYSKSAADKYFPIEARVNDYINLSNSINSQYKPYYDKYNAEVAARNKFLLPYKPEIDAYNKSITQYNTDVEKYKKQYNSIFDQFQADRQKTAVADQEQMQSEGNALAASDLYSDDLHNQMLQRVASANAPTEDNVSSLFARGK